MRNDLRIFDADSHIIEPPDLWKPVAEAHPRSEFVYSNEYPDGTPRWLPYTVKGHDAYRHLVPKQLDDLQEHNDHNPHKEIYQSGTTPQYHAEGLRGMGTDRAIVYPTFGLWMVANDDIPPPVTGALVDTYNDWVDRYCREYPDLLLPVGAVNLHAPEGLVDEARALAARGWKTVFVRPNPTQGRLLGDPAYEPFWAECERLGLSVGIHEATHANLPSTGADRFTSRFSLHSCSHPMEHMMALLSLLEGGVLERHPTLEFAFIEAGCGWVPYWLWRLDEEYEQLGWEVQDTIKMNPSDYFRRQCYVTWEPDEPYLQWVVDHVGADRVMVGTDFPHIDSKMDCYDRVFEHGASVGRATLQKILWDNPCAFYRQPV